MVSVGAGKNCGGKITDGLGNVQFPGNDCGSTILVGDPQLGQLSNNGGATQTMALSTTSGSSGRAIASKFEWPFLNSKSPYSLNM